MLLDRSHFPIFKNVPELAYFDNAATTQIHQFVLDAMLKYYTEYRASPGRGEYSLASRASAAVENACEQVAALIGADSENILFTRGATDALNRVARWHSSVNTVIISEAEHNSNIVPWLAQGRKKGEGLQVLPVDDTGLIDVELASNIISRYPNSLISIASVTNTTGELQPIHTIREIARTYGCSLCIDACQGIAHIDHNVKELDPDWLLFSGHKMYGPNGVGVLYSKHDLTAIKSLEFGGGAVRHTTFDTFDLPESMEKHSPGTPDTAGIIGIGVAAEIINYDSYSQIQLAESEVVSWLDQAGLFKLPDLFFISEHKLKGKERSILSFYPARNHSSDIATLMSESGVAIRTGRVCAHPMVDKHFGSNGIVRISVSPYNTQEDCNKLVAELSRTLNFLNKHITQ